jgi:uncharacterized membrane protein
MKTTLAALALCLAAGTASAQVFRPEIVTGSALGAIAGAVIGNNSGDLRHDAWTGAALGAGAGALLGAVTAQANDHVNHDNTQVAYPGRRSGDITGGSRAVQGAVLGGLAGAIVGNNSRGHNGAKGAAIGAASGLVLGAIADANAARPAPAYNTVYSSDVPRSAPAPQSVYTGGNRAVQGALIGGLAGAIIGNNSRRHDSGRGAAIGAATGLVLGAMADDHGYGRYGFGYPGGHYRVGVGYGWGHDRHYGYGWNRGHGHRRGWDRSDHWGHYPRSYGSIFWEPAPIVVERPVAVYQPAPAYTPPPAPAPQQITIINNYYGADATAMSGANGLFGR